MAAFVYSLNDTDERVRAEAADEIGDQVRKHGCCCMTDRALEALKVALGDCDSNVSRQAEEALQVCGYYVEDHCSPKCGISLPKCGSNLLSGLLAKCKSSCTPKCGADANAECGAKSSDKCCPPASAASTPGCKAPEAPAGGGDAEPSPSAADAPEAAKEADSKPAPAPPEEAAKKAADDKTASTTRPRSVLTRLFGLVKK